MADAQTDIAPHTLADLAGSADMQTDDQQLPDEARDALREDIGSFGAGLAQLFTTAGILVALNKALDVPLTDILKSGWSSAVDLQPYLDPEKHPPEETTWVDFGKQKLTSTHNPKLEVLVNGKRVGTLTFDVVLTLHITATKLLVGNGRIWQATGTAFKGDCRLSYKGFPFIKKQIAKVSLPGTLNFAEGVRISKLPVAVG
ncbi:hypothetical protein [Yoonia sediminilitoris]|uniref:Uncharacterized protein n=1 Tax=Yoonia sediminilitoris TaxID=1286148 RepID=A0A2T6KC27_9RHOB|nr:hypothetical protein [Yoonia sediminilitoris]PUB12454.1 hypothetical protein C8N45_11093 [Yoonia sediminilitoris]RCW93148.1 hypothetical protein DFP92_11093 [Yoonia sediminilitoris]